MERTTNGGRCTLLPPPPRAAENRKNRGKRPFTRGSRRVSALICGRCGSGEVRETLERTRLFLEVLVKEGGSFFLFFFLEGEIERMEGRGAVVVFSSSSFFPLPLVFSPFQDPFQGSFC